MDGLQVLTFFGVLILVALEGMKLVGSILSARQMRDMQGKEITFEELKDLVAKAEAEEESER